MEDKSTEIDFLQRKNKEFQRELLEMIGELAPPKPPGLFPGVLWFDPWRVYKRSLTYSQGLVFLLEDKEERVAAVAEMSTELNEYLGTLGVVSTLMFSITVPLAFENLQRSDTEEILPESWGFADDLHTGYANFVFHTGMMFSTLFSVSSVLFSIMSFMFMNMVFVDASQKMWYIREGCMGTLRWPEIFLVGSVFSIAAGAAGGIFLAQGATALVISLLAANGMVVVFVDWIMLMIWKGVKHNDAAWKLMAEKLTKLSLDQASATPFASRPNHGKKPDIEQEFDKFVQDFAVCQRHVASIGLEWHDLLKLSDSLVVENLLHHCGKQLSPQARLSVLLVAATARERGWTDPERVRQEHGWKGGEGEGEGVGGDDSKPAMGVEYAPDSERTDKQKPINSCWTEVSQGIGSDKDEDGVEEERRGQGEVGCKAETEHLGIPGEVSM